MLSKAKSTHSVLEQRLIRNPQFTQFISEHAVDPRFETAANRNYNSLGRVAETCVLQCTSYVFLCGSN